MGRVSASITVFKDGSQFDIASAHEGVITEIIYSQINGEELFLTSSLDGTVKAWQVAEVTEPSGTLENPEKAGINSIVAHETE